VIATLALLHPTLLTLAGALALAAAARRAARRRRSRFRKKPGG
jgi:hypothetical protein